MSVVDKHLARWAAAPGAVGGYQALRLLTFDIIIKVRVAALGVWRVYGGCVQVTSYTWGPLSGESSNPCLLSLPGYFVMNITNMWHPFG